VLGKILARHKLTCQALGKVTFKKVLKTGLIQWSELGCYIYYKADHVGGVAKCIHEFEQTN
jgi:hypothetical protein